MNKKQFWISCIIIISVGAIVLGYYIYNVLDTFTPTSDTANIPIEVDTTVDPAIAAAPAEVIGNDPAPDQPAAWSTTLIDQSGGYFLDPATNAVYEVDGDGNIYDDNGNMIDDATGQPMTN